ncbi:MAG: hypothetical protein LR005_02385 [Candidatus Pacebacteria bacterium]|nr:hypothetical protein [Candidatus Paceibacterota bacterium]
MSAGKNYTSGHLLLASPIHLVFDIYYTGTLLLCLVLVIDTQHKRDKQTRITLTSTAIKSGKIKST